jgi:putative methyltransferase (TIGR04325 family)
MTKGIDPLNLANDKFTQGKFKEARELYKKALADNPDLIHTGISITLAHTIILSTDWNEVSKNLLPDINYLESSGWLNSLLAGKPINKESKPIPWYTYPAIEFIEDKLRIDFRVFEYGSGQSTFWWAQRVAQVVSVENDTNWFLSIQNNLPKNVKLSCIEEASQYSAEILNYPDDYFDVIIIDGINRNACTKTCVNKLKNTGFIIFDNTDNKDYDEGVTFLDNKGFKRIDFYGLISSYTYKNCTSIFFINNEFLSQNNLPSNKQSCLGWSCFQITNPKVKTVDNILASVEQYQQAPTNQSALTMFADSLDKNPSSYFNQSSITNLVQEREQLTYQLLNLSEEQLISAYLGDLGEAHKRLLNSDIKDQNFTENEREFVNELLKKQCEGIQPPAWEYLPEGWKAKDSSLKGWNVQSILDIRKANWPYFLELTQNTSPLGQNYATHNTYMTYAYVLALAARKKDCISLLDWGGGVGDYYLISKALLPEIKIDYHCKEVPLLCQGGRELLPKANFYENEEDCFKRSYDLIFSSGSLQYWEDWRQIAQKLASVTRSYLYITRLPVVHQVPSFVVVQRPYNYGYQTEYMGWFLNREEFLNYMIGLDMELVREFLIAENFPIPGAPEPGEGRGFLFRPRTGGDEA